jgi:iron complex outermembrane receptor protein
VRLKNISSLIGASLVAVMANSYADDAISLEGITVTGERGQQSIIEQPVSIGYKKKAEVELDGATNQKELLNSIAGVRITQTGSSIGHMASIRLPTNTGPYYLYLQDSIPVQSSGFFNHNGLAYTNFSTAGSVEVLKGAGTALYGSDAVAATINVISAPERDQIGVKMTAETGSDGFRRVLASAGVDIDQTSTITAQASHAQADGWRDHTEYDRQEVAIKYINDLNDSNTLKIGFSANKTEAEMAGDLIGYDAFKNQTTSVGNIQTALDSGLDIVRKFDFARANVEWDHAISDTATFNSIAYVRSNRNRYVATWENNLPQNDTQENSVGLLLKNNLDFGALRNITGLDVEYTQATKEYTQLFDFVPTGFGSSVAAGKIYDYDVNYLAIAPYTRFEYLVTDNLKVGAGVRFDTNRYDYTNNLADGQYAASSYLRPNSDNDPSYSHISPKLDLTYQFNNGQMVYARYANGFRIPQASTLYSLKTNNISFSIDEEVTDTYEVGYKFVTERYEFASSLYLLTIDDTIVRRQNSAGDRFYENGGKTTHKGIELSLSSKLTDEFTSKIAYSYSKHKFDNDEVFGDNEQAQAPNNVANVRFIYSPKSLLGLTAMVEWEHVGSSWLDDENTTRYAGHDVGNIKLRYALNEQFNVFARVMNITDRIYAESASINYGSERYTPGAPRQAFVGFEYKL